MRILLDKYGALRAPEGGGGDGGGGNGNWSAPEGVPEQYRGASADETLGKLLGGYGELNTRAEGLRTKLAGLPKAPDRPELYEYTPSDRLKPFFGDLATNPAFGLFRSAAHKHGIPQAAFAGILEDVYGPMAEKGLLPAPLDPMRELQTFSSELGLDKAGAQKALTDADAFAKGLSAQLKDVPEKMREQVNDLLLGLTDTAAGNVLLRALSGRLAENGIRIGGDGNAAGEITAADLKKLDADPRIDPQNTNHPDVNKRFDPDLRKRYDDAYRRLAPPNKTAF